jgi:aminoglycoside phosphotransferase (APT) family kinase protein
VCAPSACARRCTGESLSRRAAAERAEQIVERIRRLQRETTLLNDDVVRVYQDAIEAPIDVEPTWLHGDLHGGNLLVDDDGVITGVIDWGDMTAAIARRTSQRCG